MVGSDEDPGSQAGVGTVRLLRVADSEFDRYLEDADATTRRRIGSDYWRMRGFAPSFDPALAYAPPTYLSVDAYALYRNRDLDTDFGAGLLREHPDWVLRDPGGRPLYIPFDCHAGECPQFAADFGDPGWQSYLIRTTRRLMEAGYAGVHVDDVNMEWRVSDGSGSFVRPFDPRTGEPMLLTDWRRYMAEFMERIRASFPGAEISHNAIWFAGHRNRYVARELRAADQIQIERALTDRGLQPGGGRFGFERLLEQIDWLHSEGIDVIYQPYDLNRSTAEFELAGYLIMGDGTDSIATTFRTDPGRIWSGWRLRLGPPEGDRYEDAGLLRRDFAGGVALLNPPGSIAVDYDLDGAMRTLDGQPITDVRLLPGEGAVLTKG